MTGLAPRLIHHGDVPHGIVDTIEGLVAFCALKCGFASIEQPCLPILTNVFITFVESIGCKSLGYSESAGRTKIILNDLLLAFVDFGLDLTSFLDYTHKQQLRSFKEPACIGDPCQKGVSCKPIVGPGSAIVIPRTLRLRSDIPTSNQVTGRGTVNVTGPVCSSVNTGTRLGQSVSTGSIPLSRPAMLPKIPAHLFLPALPEPHTYISSKVTRPPPANSWAALRRRVIDERREAQLSLTKFLARIQTVHQLFPGDLESFPLLLSAPSDRPYLSALLADSLPESQEENLTSSKEPKMSSSSSKHQTMSDDRGQKVNFYLEKPEFPSGDLDSTSFV